MRLKKKFLEENNQDLSSKSVYGVFKNKEDAKGQSRKTAEEQEKMMDTKSDVNEEDIKILKDIFLKTIIDVAQKAKAQNKNTEPILRVVIPGEFIEGIKNG